MEPNPASRKVYEALVTFFESEGWKIGRCDERLALHMIAGGKNGNYPCFVQVRPEHPLVLFYAVVGFRVPEDKLSAMAEYVTRANYGICVGNFEMDYSDGELRFKTSMDIRDGELTHDMAKALVLTNLYTIDRYVPGMMSVVSTGESPNAAVAKAEGRHTPPVNAALSLSKRSTDWPPFLRN